MIRDRFMMRVPRTRISGKGAELFMTMMVSVTVSLAPSLTSMESAKTILALHVSSPEIR